MHSAGFEPAIPAIERLQTYVTRTGNCSSMLTHITTDTGTLLPLRMLLH